MLALYLLVRFIILAVLMLTKHRLDAKTVKMLTLADNAILFLFMVALFTNVVRLA